MRHSIRWTLLPRSAVSLLLLLVGYVEMQLWLYQQGTGGSLDQPPMLQVRESAGGLLVLFMGWYGAYRALKFHPVVHSKYRQWLELSPWTNRLPLPLGPVMFVWQDALLIAAVSA